MQTYDSYKDSGEQWLGRIPSHWEIRRSKFLWKETDRRSQKGTEQLLSVSQYDGVREANAESRSESLVGYKYVHKDEFVINIMLAWLGGLGISNFEGVVSPAYCVYHLKDKQNPRFLHYLYRTPQYLAEFARHSTGIVPSRWRMYTDDFGDVLTILPPIEEQNRMVQYLDEQTSQIDEVIAQQQKMIDLLNERKQIIINNAVTKGLDPNVSMKDSGIDWIGKMPNHWELKQYKYLFYNFDNLRKPITADQRSRDNPMYDYYGASGVIDKIDYYNIDDKVLLIGEDGANLLMRNLPLVYKAKGKFWVNNHAHILKPIKDNYDFMALVMEAADYTLFITGSAQPKLSQANLNSVKLPIPPIEEQEKIVNFVNENAGILDFPLKKAKKQVELLQERKQIIINEVVTGKINV